MQAPAIWRETESRNLVGDICPRCGAKNFPAGRPTCSVCSGYEVQRGIGVLPVTLIKGIPHVIFQEILKEDGEKSEGNSFSEELAPITQGMLGLLTGAVEEGEDLDTAFYRELKEEFGGATLLNRKGNWLDSRQIAQERKGKQVLFRVYRGIQADVEGDFSGDNFRLVKLSELNQFIKENKSLIRPAAHAVLELVGR